MIAIDLPIRLLLLNLNYGFRDASLSIFFKNTGTRGEVAGLVPFCAGSGQGFRKYAPGQAYQLVAGLSCQTFLGPPAHK